MIINPIIVFLLVIVHPLNTFGQINFLDLKERTIYADYLKIDTSIINQEKTVNSFWISIPKKIKKGIILGNGGIGYSFINSNACGFYAWIALKKDSIFISTQSHRSFDVCLSRKCSFSQIIWSCFSGDFEAKYTIENNKMIIKNDKIHLILDLSSE